MIMFEMMEGELPYESADSGSIYKLIIDVKNGKVKQLKSTRPPALISLYKSMCNIV
jgi:hypothetical protein